MKSVPTARLAFALALTIIPLNALLAGDHHTLRFHERSSGYAATARGIALSPDSKELVLWDNLDKLTFVAIAEGETIAEIRGTPFAAAYSKDGRRLLVAAASGWASFDTKTRKQTAVSIRDTDGFLGIRFAQKNGKIVVEQLTEGGPAAASGKLKVGDEITGIGHGMAADIASVIGYSVARATDALKGPAKTLVRIQVVHRGQAEPDVVVLRRAAARKSGDRLEFVKSSDGPITDNLLHYNDRGYQMFASARDGSALGGLTTESIENVGQYAISPDQQHLVVVARKKGDRKKCGFETFELRSLERRFFAALPHESFIHVRYSTDGKEILIASRARVDAFDAEKGTFLRGYTLDGKLSKKLDEPAVAAKSELPAGDAGRVIGAAADSVGIRPVPPQKVQKIAVSARLLATASPLGEISLWSLEDGTLLKTLSEKESKHPAEQLEFTPDGQWLVYFIRGTLHLVNVADVKAMPK